MTLSDTPNRPLSRQHSHSLTFLDPDSSKTPHLSTLFSHLTLPVRLLSVLFLSLLMTSCGDGTTTYTGHLIEIDFSNSEQIMDGHWIEVDGVRFTHYLDFDAAHEGFYSLPASMVQEIGAEPYPSFGGHHRIAIMLGNHLKHIEASESAEPKTANTVTVTNELLMYAQSRLHLSADNGDPFSVKTSPDYPVPVYVIE